MRGQFTSVDSFHFSCPLEHPVALRRTLPSAGALTAALVVPAAAAAADTPLSATHNLAMCGQVSIIFNNNSDYDFLADYKVGDQEGEEDEATGEKIDGGTHDGKPFGPVYTPVDVPAGESVTEVVDVEEDTEVSYRIWRGPENDWYVPCQSVEVAGGADESDGEDGDKGEGDDGKGDEGGDNGEGDDGKGDDGGDNGKGEDDKPAPEDSKPESGDASGSLPVTGGALAGLVAAGVATLGAGGGALYMSRKRKAAAEADSDE